MLGRIETGLMFQAYIPPNNPSLSVRYTIINVTIFCLYSLGVPCIVFNNFKTLRKERTTITAIFDTLNIASHK